MTATYVYGVIRAPAELTLPDTAVAGQRPECLVHGPVAAVVAPLPAEALRVRARDLQSHLEVLRAVNAATTVVPCRFGTIFDSPDAVLDELLDARRDELLALLDRLEGRSQFVLTARYDEDAVLREIVAAEPQIAALRSTASRYGEQLQLGELVAVALDARGRRDAQAIESTLAPHVEAIVTDEPGTERVLRASFLVADARADAFEHAVEELARSGDGRLLYELIGPLPATAFVELAETEAAAWA